MRKSTRLLTIGLAFVMLFAMLAFSVSAAETKFTDVSAKDETLTKAVALLEGIGVTKGTSDTTFGTNEAVTRQQMAAFIYRLMNRGKSLEGGENFTPFEDLYDDTFYGMVSWASSMGVIKGISATEFDPDGSIILQDAYTMIVRALGYEKKGELAYPFDYIEIAETSGVDLADGLPSSVSYEKELTRGNVAILLYNAFYADMGQEEEKERVKWIGASKEDGKYVLEKYMEQPKLCEKVYDVIEEEFQIVETPHYAFNTSKDSNTYKPTEDSNGEGSLLLVATEDDQKVGSFYMTASELGLTGDADSYIMSHVNVFYTYNEDDKKVDSVLVATPLMAKASADSASYGSVSAERIAKDARKYFYAPADQSWARMDGSMTVAGKQLYFYDAPYSFLKPSYVGCDTDADKYAARNAHNTLLIDLKCTDVDKGLYTYYIRDERFETRDGVDDNANATEWYNNLAYTFQQVRESGIYHMDIYDPDGDGKYEYMWYKPATFGKIDMTEDSDFTDYAEYANNAPVVEAVKNANSNGFNKIPMIYANGATIDGAKGSTFRDGDFVIAYLNGEANYIYYFGSATAKKGVITKVNTPTGTVNIGNQSFRTCYQFLYVENFFSNENGKSATTNSGSANTGAEMTTKLTSKTALGEEVILYTYNKNYNNVFYFEVVKSGSSAYSGENLLIPLEVETEKANDEKTHKTMQYLKVWVDGKEQYVPVDIDGCYPRPQKTVDGTYKFDVTVAEEDGREYNAYIGKVCTYSVDKNGYYTIESLLHSRDSDGEPNHIDLTFDPDDDSFFNTKDVSQVATDLQGERIRLEKTLSKRYTITDFDTALSMIGTYGTTGAKQYFDFKEAIVTDETTFVIREISIDDDGKEENTFTVYKGTEFPGTVESELTNVQYVYENDGASKARVNLVLFYAEVDGDIEFESSTSSKKSDIRIVKTSSPVKVDEDEYRYAYDLYNPNTGKVDEGVYGTLSKANASSLASEKPFAPGSVIKLTTAGKVDDKKDIIGTIDADTNKNLVFFDDVDTNDMAAELHVVNAEDVDFITVDGTEYSLFEIDENVSVSLLKFSKKTDISTAEISAIKLSDLVDPKNDLKAYNTGVEDKNGKLSTKYGEFVKAYITFSKKASAERPLIESIIVIVNSGEPEEFLKK